MKTKRNKLKKFHKTWIRKIYEKQYGIPYELRVRNLSESEW